MKAPHHGHVQTDASKPSFGDLAVSFSGLSVTIPQFATAHLEHPEYPSHFNTPMTPEVGFSLSDSVRMRPHGH